eukprot:TRINITY_DN19703_c1_g1_i1.p1 TRINITY_DN19703_c1_g1~~TRINITY_DN19703_c1_g1_i1.p1  ORF type:complete len:231 (-),score=31.32 TRINITY_DN19703_c1_g1_i1:84-776(-)
MASVSARMAETDLHFKPLAPPPNQLRPPRPPGTQRPQPHIQGLQSESRSSSRPGNREGHSLSASQSSDSGAKALGQQERGYPLHLPAGTQGRLLSQHSTEMEGRPTEAHGWPVSSSASGASTSPAAVASMPSSSASTRTPSPGAGIASNGLVFGALSGLTAATAAATGGRPRSAPMAAGQVAAPVRWKWHPQDADRDLREKGQGASHLKTRKANLARIREIQGLGRERTS